MITRDDKNEGPHYACLFTCVPMTSGVIGRDFILFLAQKHFENMEHATSLDVLLCLELSKQDTA